jgi:hypothetical protein
MAENITFRMVNDQSGEEVAATLASEQEYRDKGFRILDTGRYDAAVGAFTDALRQPARPDPRRQAIDQQTYNDALLVASNTYPEATAQTGAEISGEDTSGITGDAAPTAPGGMTSPADLSAEDRRTRYESGTVAQLRQYAEQRGVDLDGATKKDEIIDRLMEADAAGA